MNQKEQALAVVGALESLQAIALNTSNRRKKMRLDVGICTPTAHRLAELDDKVKRLWYGHKVKCFESWPEFSGDKRMPVPVPKGVDSDPDRYYWTTCNKWGGAYGKARMRLLAHCIAYFKALSEAE